MLAALALGAAIAAAGAWQASRAPALALAAPDERHYAVLLQKRPVGRLTLGTARDVEGSRTVHSRLVFELSPGERIEVRESRRFAGTPPYRLLEARQSERSSAGAAEVDVQSAAPGYRARISRGGSVSVRELAFEHTLRDYLSLEVWLARERPAPPARHVSPSFDFSRLDMRTDAWRLEARTADGFELSRPTALAPSTTVLDSALRPVRFDLAGAFEIEYLGAAPPPWSAEPIFHGQQRRILLDGAIADPQRLEALELRIAGDADWLARWGLARRDDYGWRLENRSGALRPAGPDEAAAALAEGLSYPTSSPEVRALAAEAAAGAVTPRQQAQALTRFVNAHLVYDEDTRPLGIQQVLRDRRGDCNEFAELFTTLARALGLPTRTVIGVAYGERPEPGFSLHAWNEVLLDGAWEYFDPTWGQTRVDATHLALPVAGGGLLTLLATLDDLRFSVVRLRHTE